MDQPTNYLHKYPNQYQYDANSYQTYNVNQEMDKIKKRYFLSKNFVVVFKYFFKIKIILEEKF